MAGLGRDITGTDGKTYHLSPLLMSDMAELEVWIKSRPFAEAGKQLEAMGEAAGEQERDAIMDRAFGALAALNESNNVFDSQYGKGLGASLFLLWRSLLRSHPDIKLPEVGKLIAMSEIEKFRDAFGEVMDMAGKVKAPTT